MKLFTHHHYGWRAHSAGTGPFDAAAIELALMSTHGFLKEYEGKYRSEIELTPDYSFDGILRVFWETKERCPASTWFFPIVKGNQWFRAFEFQFADDFACRHCGGTGIDHYYGPFLHCWACDGTKKQVRDSMPRGFMHKPTKHAAKGTHLRYEAWKETQA